MKYLLFFSLFAFTFMACEKNDLTTLDDLRSEALVWQLDASIISPGGESITRLIESNRTLQFWEGELWSNGSFCDLDGPVGEFQGIGYDPINSNFTIGPCSTDSTSYSITWPFRIDQEMKYLYITHPWCIEECSLRYRRKTD